MEPYYDRAGIVLYLGDNRDILPHLEPESISAVCTDPPYGLSKEPDMAEVLTHWLAGDDYTHKGGGFMGKSWDSFVPGPTTWRAIEATMKPGAHLLSFAGTRTSDLMGIAIRLAGLERRDTILSWIVGSGFPKSANVSKMIDKQRKDDVTHVTAFVREHAVAVPRKAMVQALGFPGTNGTHGVASFVSDDPSKARVPTWEQWVQLKALLGFGDEMDAEVWRLNGRKGQPDEAWYERPKVDLSPPGMRESWTEGRGWNGNVARGGDPITDAAKQWEGWGTALKPAHEDIGVFRKRFKTSVVANILAHGTGAINVDACRVASGPDYHELNVVQGGNHRHDVGLTEKTRHAPFQPASGRWPPNVLLDEAAARDLDAMSDKLKPATSRTPSDARGVTSFSAGNNLHIYQDAHNGASRFFPVLPIDDPETLRFMYQAKAPASERVKSTDGTSHPTQKPLALMRWILTLVTPPGGAVILDPFAGSGSTMVAAAQLGISAVGIEMDSEYAEIAARRIDHVLNATRQPALSMDVAD